MLGTSTSAVIAAAAAVLAGLLTAYATRSVERLRLRAALLEKADERRLATIEEFMLAANAWLDWLDYIREDGWQDNTTNSIGECAVSSAHCSVRTW